VYKRQALYDATKERKYLDAATEKALLGVLPGLMENGYWLDPHNAKLSYHFIMVRALNELLRVLPKDHPRYREIREKTLLATDARAKDILRDGAPEGDSVLMALALVLHDLEESPLRRDAARAAANALLAARNHGPASLPLYIRYRTQTDQPIP